MPLPEGSSLEGDPFPFGAPGAQLDATSLILPLEFRSDVKTGEITRKLDPIR
jgi:hypothetical protein